MEWNMYFHPYMHRIPWTSFEYQRRATVRIHAANLRKHRPLEL